MTGDLAKKEMHDGMSQFSKPISQYTTFEELLETKGYLVYTNVGTSMMPLLRQRKDIIEIRRKGPERCKKYDAVLYKRGGRYILHRILKVLPDGYLIAGDHCTIVEKDIKDKNILGIMTRVIRKGKSITPDNFWYKVYVHLWCDFYPVRMIIIRSKQKARGILSTAKRRIFRHSQDDKGLYEQQSSED